MIKKIFISYSHEDEKYMSKLRDAFCVPVRNKEIEVFEDTQIAAGKEWNEEILSNFQSSAIILLLISPAFVKSEYIYSMELKEAIQKHKNRNAVVIPIIVRSTPRWKNLNIGGFDLGRLKALPKDAKPINQDRIDDDNIWAELVDKILQ